MVQDVELVKRLNLLRSSDAFVLRELSHDGSAEVLRTPRVPRGSGVYWVSGSTLMRNGLHVESVFRIDTDAGATLLAAFWWLDGHWYQQDDPGAPNALRVPRSDVFPFDWRFAVPVEHDEFHP
jgi:hypothetical protein